MTADDILGRARAAIAGIESGGRYGITGPATRGDVPLGRYQIMTSNLPSWSMAALGRQVTPQEFLASPALQDAIFNHRFGGYLNKYGPEGAARAWFGGEGAVSRDAGNRRDILGTSVDSYGQKFMSAFRGGGAPAFDPSSLSDDDLRRELGLAPGGAPGAPDVSALSDDELRKELGLADSPAPSKKDRYDLAEVPGAAMSNLGADAAQVGKEVKDLASAVVNDPAGVAKSIGSGLYGSAVAAVLPDLKAITRAFGGNQQAVEAWAKRQGADKSPLQPLADAMSDPAKAYEDLKKDVAERPVHAALNVATMAAPGGGGAGRAALKTATATAGAVDSAVAGSVGRALTGVSGDLQREALRAGVAGGAQAREFRGQLRGTASPDRPVQLAEEAEAAIHRRGLADRDATLSGGRGTQAAAQTPARLNAALQAARRENRDVAGIVQNADIEDMLNALQRHIDEAFPNGRPLNAAVLSVDGMDALKRRIGTELADRGVFNSGGQAGRIGGDVYNAVKDAITDAYPEYAPGMARAERSIRELQQVQRQLSLRSQNRATTAGKLQQALRNDAHSAYGTRREALDVLRAERPELVSALAGQALGSMSPRGIAPWMLMAGHMGASPPTALLQYIASIPRLHGEARYALGSAIRGARKTGLTQKNIGNLFDALRLAAEQEQEDEK
jgi:hypothetical protein